MPNTLKKIGEDEYRFDCECGRIHLISSDGPDGKPKIETINKPKGKSDDDTGGKDDSGDPSKKRTPPARKGFFDGIL